VEYHDQVTPAIFVRFKMISDIGERVPELRARTLSVVIWTTTPWTIPANLAVALHPDMEYAAIKTDKYGVLIMANELVESVMSAAG
jgi:isoleucyl-tRNA synthetase